MENKLITTQLRILLIEACRWIGLSGGTHPAGETVFPLPSNPTLCRILRQWTTEAGITKHVTFHTARHSYATMALTTGVDIYTISKLLGHRSITTTTLYATVVDSQRDAAVDTDNPAEEKRVKDTFARKKSEDEYVIIEYEGSNLISKVEAEIMGVML